MSDNIHNPDHYTAGGIETIDYIKAKLGPSGFEAYCIGNAMKYLSRYRRKGHPKEDLEKARVYIGWAIESMEQENGNDEFVFRAR